jgi:hypothetical protein
MVETIFVKFMANILNTIESTIRIDIKNAKLNKKLQLEDYIHVCLDIQDFS